MAASKSLRGKHFQFSGGAQVTLNPNGQPNAIWLKDERGHGIEIQTSVGPYGFGLHLRSFVGTMPLTVGGNLADGAQPKRCGDFTHLEITQYGGDDASQSYKVKYAKGNL